MVWGSLGQPQDAPGSLTIKDANQSRVTIDRLEPSEARRTLGVRLAPDGDNQDQYEFMIEKATAWSEKVCASYLKTPNIWIAMQSTISKTLE